MVLHPAAWLIPPHIPSHTLLHMLASSLWCPNPPSTTCPCSHRPGSPLTALSSHSMASRPQGLSNGVQGSCFCASDDASVGLEHSSQHTTFLLQVLYLVSLLCPLGAGRDSFRCDLWSMMLWQLEHLSLHWLLMSLERPWVSGTTFLIPELPLPSTKELNIW